jgi:alkylhydroperoxidase family enzyme
VQQVLADYRSAPISERMRALLTLVECVNSNPASVSEYDVERARSAGWPDEALYDALTVCALFRFYNTWIDATGVSDMPQFLYDMQAERLAMEGYDVPADADAACQK